jgi:hypothetical protein
MGVIEQDTAFVAVSGLSGGGHRVTLETPPSHPGHREDSMSLTTDELAAAVRRLRDALLTEPGASGEAWLAARNGSVARQRSVLLARVAALSAQVGTAPAGAVREGVHRLTLDVEHHVQRLHDLAYDEVELELGGSE